MCWVSSGLHPGTTFRQALNTALSLRSVLDDEGSNLRQQKLDRQVSEAGARWEGSQHLPSSPESGLESREQQGACLLPGVS